MKIPAHLTIYIYKIFFGYIKIYIEIYIYICLDIYIYIYMSRYIYIYMYMDLSIPKAWRRQRNGAMRL
jgi:hypothetical protein